MSKPKKWTQTLEDLPAGDAAPLGERAALNDRAADWDTCAVGECLTDICGIPDARGIIAEKTPFLDMNGSKFYMAIKTHNWKQALETLADIRRYVHENKDTLLGRYHTLKHPTKA